MLCATSVDHLLGVPFSGLDLSQRITVVHGGRPRPDLTEDGPRVQLRYVLVDWLTACPQRSKLFCWTCLLYANFVEDTNHDQTQVWTRDGVAPDVSSEEVARHTDSFLHRRTRWMLEQFIEDFGGSVSDQTMPDGYYEHLYSFYNPCLDSLDRETEILSCYLLHLTIGLNFANKTKLFDQSTLERFFTEFYPEMQQVSVFQDPIRVHQTMLRAMFDSVIEAIRSEVIEASFVAVAFEVLHDFTSNECHLATSLRYVNHNRHEFGESFDWERFIGFQALPKNYDLWSSLVYVITEFDLGDKLVMVTLDGETLSNQTLFAFAHSLTINYPKVILSHSAKVTDYLQHRLCHISPDINGFFEELRILGQFIKTNAKALSEKPFWKYYKFGSVTGMSLSKVCIIVEKARKELLKFCREIQNNRVKMILKGMPSILLVPVFGEFFTRVARVERTLEDRVLYDTFTEQVFDHSLSPLRELSLNLRDKLNLVWDDAVDLYLIVNQGEIPPDNLVKNFYTSQLDCIIQVLAEIFRIRTAHLSGLRFFNIFQGQGKQNVTAKVALLVSSKFANHFDLDQLTIELDYLNCFDPRLFEGEPLDYYFHFLALENLLGAFPQTSKLLALILTIAPSTPFFASETIGRGFNKRDQILAIYTQPLVRFKAEGFLRIEPQLLQQLVRTGKEFYRKTLIKFRQFWKT